MSINQIARIDSFTLDGGGEITGYNLDAGATYAFDSITGNEHRPEEQVQILTHKGIRGHIIRTMPAVGQPFDMVATLHTELLEDWASLLAIYQENLIGAANGVVLRRHDSEYIWPLDVVSVQKVHHHEAAGGVGTLIDNAALSVGALAYFRFRLIGRG